jgi:hypothetical protein
VVSAAKGAYLTLHVVYQKVEISVWKVCWRGFAPAPRKASPLARGHSAAGRPYGQGLDFGHYRFHSACLVW